MAALETPMIATGRRRFLRAAASAVGGAASISLLSCATRPRDVDVIVIGAGLAGLTAALGLEARGLSVIVLEAVLFTALVFSYSKIQSLTHLYLIHVGFGLSLVCAGLGCAVVLSSQWFVRARGTAVGIALTGSSLGGVVFPPIILVLIGSYGWRDAFTYMAIFPVILFVLAFLLVRSPQDMGIAPLGAGEVVKGGGAAPSPNDLTYHQAIRTVSFWALTFVAMASFYSILALAAHLFLHMRDMGFDLKAAGGALGLLFGLGLISKFLFGFLSDILNPRVVFVTNVGIMLAGVLLMATFNKDVIWAGIAITGFGWGGLYTLIQLQTVNNFGVSHTGKILGTITMLDAIAGGFGIWLTGVMFDKFGNYHNAFYLLCGLLIAAFIASFFVKREVKVGA
jgi:MFS family permease